MRGFMKRLLLVLFAGAVLPAAAAPQCAGTAQMKALQAAILEQQLAASAQSCHYGEDYGRFVSRYQAALLQTDRDLRGFFAKHPEAEGYEAYKARIAGDIALRNLHDPQFCSRAKAVFDMALRHQAASAAPPAVMATGYENCRMVQAPAAPKPQVATAAPAKPKPQPAVAVPLPSKRPAAAVLAVQPKPRPALPSAAAPVRTASLDAAKPQPAAARPATVVTAKPVTAVMAKSEVPAAAKQPKSAPAPVKDDGWPDFDQDDDLSTDGLAADDEAPPQNAAAAERPHWRSAHNDVPDNAALAERNVPNAYQPGAQWVPDQPQRKPRGKSHLVLGPDGRWYVVIGHRRSWNGE